jgi:NTP pyrophosphatase (non-canonical NTP hydrolase)
MKQINTLTKKAAGKFREVVDLPNLLNQYQQLATRSAFYPGQGTALGLAYVALKMNGEAGEFAEHTGKAMRDDDLIPETTLNSDGSGWPPHKVAELDGQLTRERHLALVKEVGDILWYAAAACNELGITLADAAATNLEKLADRTERGALQGSGDNR